MLLLLLACAPKPVPISPDLLPHIPALTSVVYRRQTGIPRDPVVAAVVGDRAWDEALSGAAGALALADINHSRIDARALRWFAIRAGYAATPSGLAMVTVSNGEIPPSIVRAIASSTGDLGLARARGRDGDHWVVIFGDRPASDLAFPREVALHDVLDFAPAAAVATDPYGSVRPAASSILFDSAGEWLVQITGADGVQTTLPMYAGITTPAGPPLPADDAVGDVVTVALTQIGAVREWYGQAPLENDGMLESVARAHLRRVLDHAEGDADAALRAAGFLAEPAAMSTCTAATVADCLDRLWWSPTGRGPLVGGFHAVSVAGERSTTGVTLVVAAAG